ncbi:MAG: glycine/betaine ABC transporter [Roseovarius sp. BRH_c41]|jgi:glycine betaine/proline transport system substrate-binding protein|uniref:glycine betaine ABC transporter substrate-binding protein n=1 Tax=Roseovarius sp. BRH_c41 TaxID=1629709 RepID=UPI0005F10DE7|nr:glycine betaine ABC transporter substrate-binding protein [Roseovarius sp. BRH_c41]KJS43088.1 MAG: glycine/betaine ABC transporter [Roseovarius sp. BRH_c41]
MKRIVKIIISAIAALQLATVAPAQEQTIQMGTMTWGDLTPITGISKKALENAGYAVDVTQFTEWGIAYAALAKGDIEILVSQVNYTAQDYWDKNKNRLEKLSPVSHGLNYGIVVPDYVTIDTIDELAANADKFKGQIVGIEPGAGLMRHTRNAIEAYGLDMRLIEGSTPAMTAALQSAVERNEWIAATLWEPSWMKQKYPVKYLKDTKGVYPPTQTYYWIATKGWAAENPKAREVLASVYVPLEDINALNGAVKDGQTMDEAVADWVVAHQELMTIWLNNAE